LDRINLIKTQIIKALSHVEAESGLYLNNLRIVHEDEERELVDGSEIEVLDALKELLVEDKISMNDEGENVVFFLKS
jgi:hypothetical protein